MIKEITMFEFNDFCNNHPFGSFYQTSNYAILAAEDEFDYDYIGYFENNNLVAASLILIKKITFNKKYGYAPRGFLVDYYNNELVENFTKAIKNYYKRKLVFIKIDPLFVTKTYDNKLNLLQIINPNVIDKYTSIGLKKLKDNLYFESQLPRFEAIVNLKNFKLENISKSARNKINKSIKKGLSFETADLEKLNIFYSFISKKKEKDIKYYNNLYRIFSKNDAVDLFLVKINYEQFMENAKQNYENELLKNNKYNDILKENNTIRNLNKKMVSDKLLVIYKNDIMEASRKYADNELEKYIAGAMVIKHNNTVSIISSGFDPKMKHLSANYFLHYKIIEYYKNEFEYLNLNAISGDFEKDSPFYKLNRFKLGFNPNVHEYIGEMDLILDEKAYNNLLVTGKLHKEFDL